MSALKFAGYCRHRDFIANATHSPHVRGTQLRGQLARIAIITLRSLLPPPLPPQAEQLPQRERDQPAEHEAGFERDDQAAAQSAEPALKAAVALLQALEQVDYPQRPSLDVPPGDLGLGTRGRRCGSDDRINEEARGRQRRLWHG